MLVKMFLKLSAMPSNLWQERGKDWNWFSFLPDPCFVHSVTLLLLVNCALAQIKKKKKKVFIYFRKDIQPLGHLRRKQSFSHKHFHSFFLLCIRIEPIIFKIFDVRTWHREIIPLPASRWEVSSCPGGRRSRFCCQTQKWHQGLCGHCWLLYPWHGWFCWSAWHFWPKFPFWTWEAFPEMSFIAELVRSHKTKFEFLWVIISEFKKTPTYSHQKTCNHLYSPDW